MKRVLIFSLSYFPHVGGAEIALKEITDRVGVNDIEFHMITMRFSSHDAREERVGNVVVHRVGSGASYISKILFITRATYAGRKLHAKYNFDAMWVMMSYMLFPVVLARLQLPYLLTLQEGDPWEHMFNRWFIVPFRPLLAFGFKNASAVQTISTFLSGWARTMGYAGRLDVIPNGVAFPSVAPQHHADSNHCMLVTTSRLVHKNAVDDILRALVLLPPTVRFRVYGSGPEELALKRLAEGLGVSDRVEWKGHVEHKELFPALAECNIFIRPSRSEGMGNSFIEAMATGLPVIATQEGGIADFLFDAKRNPDKPTTGWAVDVNSPEQIAEAVKDIMANPDAVARVSENALALVREKYDWDLIAKQMRALFATLGI